MEKNLRLHGPTADSPRSECRLTARRRNVARTGTRRLPLEPRPSGRGIESPLPDGRGSGKRLTHGRVRYQRKPCPSANGGCRSCRKIASRNNRGPDTLVRKKASGLRNPRSDSHTIHRPNVAAGTGSTAMAAGGSAAICSSNSPIRRNFW